MMKRFLLTLLLGSLLISGCSNTNDKVEETIEETEVEEQPVLVITDNIVNDFVTHDIMVEPTISKYDFIKELKALKIKDYNINVITNIILSPGIFSESYEPKVIRLTKDTEDGSQIKVEIKQLYNNDSVTSRLEYYSLYLSRDDDVMAGDTLEVNRESSDCITWKVKDKAGLMALCGNIELIIECPEAMQEDVFELFYEDYFRDFEHIIDFKGLHTMDFYCDTANQEPEEILDYINIVLEDAEGDKKSIFEFEQKRYNDMIAATNTKYTTNVRNTPNQLRALLETTVDMDDTVSIHSPHEDYNTLKGNYHYCVDFITEDNRHNVLNAYPVSDNDFLKYWQQFEGDTSGNITIDEDNIVYDKTGNTYYIFSGNIIYEYILDIDEPFENHLSMVYSLLQSDLRVSITSMIKAYNY